MKPFDEVWKTCKDINGWLTENEAKHLYKNASLVPDNQIIVEVGTFCGRSAILMAHTGRIVVTVDPLISAVDHKNHLTITDLEAITLRKNIEPYPNISWFRLPSTEVNVDCLLPIGLLYIDANHQYPHPLQDCKHFLPRVVPNGMIAFHDYAKNGGNFPGVARSIKELSDVLDLKSAKIAGSMFISRTAKTH